MMDMLNKLDLVVHINQDISLYNTKITVFNLCCFIFFLI